MYWQGERNGVASPSSSSSQPPRRFVVSNQLPVKARRDAATGRLEFELDEDRLVLHVREGFEPGTEVVHVGTLPLRPDVAVSEAEENDVASRLYDELRCVAVFLRPEVHALFYHGFCKHYLWPLFHDMLPVSARAGARFERAQWRAYVAANTAFFDAIMRVADANLDEDYFWIHDYHLMALPTRLRRKNPRARLGFFLHSPFPTSEIYTTIPVRDEILRGLLNCDLVGFHTYDYARHFMSCCGRMLGQYFHNKMGHLELEYNGRIVSLKILPVGLHLGRVRSVLSQPETEAEAMALRKRFDGKVVILGVDDMDMFKGIGLKFLAFKRLLEVHKDLIGRVILVQIANPARSRGRDIQDVRDETRSVADEINQRFGDGTIEFITSPISTSRKAAFYSVADVCAVNATRDGMNLEPYKYTVCREHCPVSGEEGPGESVLIVSEFIGCSPSLSGALRVNPWDVEGVAEAMGAAVRLPAAEKRLRHEKHYNYISSHDVGYWARSFDGDLERACRYHFGRRYVTTGLPGTRVIGVSHGFRELSLDHIAQPYRGSNCRLILLDYDGTIKPHSCVNKAPSEDAIAVLNLLCSDPKNVVFIVSGRRKDSLGDWFSRCEKLGISAEHGFFTRWNSDEPWETCSSAVDFDWMKMTLPVMELYTEATDGSFIERKESALVWNHQDADTNFGSCQAKELLDHLESVLSNEPVVVRRGHQIVEVQPQGVSKGTAVQGLISTMKRNGKLPDFVLCIGDDQSDEDMFEAISRAPPANALLPSTAGVFACTLGQKSSAAKYYIDDTAQVISLLKGLASPPFHEQPKSKGHILFERPFLLESYC